MSAGWKHAIAFGAGWACGWVRREDPFVKRPRTMAALTVRPATPAPARARGYGTCLSTDMRAADDWDGCVD
jgi:hypothetical protein